MGFTNPNSTAEEVAAQHGNDEVAAWLESTVEWCSPLHHLCLIEDGRARALLRAGANINAATGVGNPTPLSIAQSMRMTGGAAAGSAADLVLQAAQPWCPATHALFPAVVRQYAVDMLLLGHRMSQDARFSGSWADLWLVHVLPHLVQRG